MLSLPVARASFFKSSLQLLSYQLGRALTYAAMGLIIGFIGSGLQLFINQKYLSLGIGLVLILMSLRYFIKFKPRANAVIPTAWLNKLYKHLSKIYNKAYWPLFAGMANGLIPCGMVYLALGTALNTGGMLTAAQFMMVFGLGTAPLLMAVSLGGIYLKKFIPWNTNKIIPWFTLFIGLLFVFRALDLGIPFLSPMLGEGYGGSAVCK